MRNIQDPDSHSQNSLFDMENAGWQHTQLAPEALAKLDNGIEGIFRRSILKLMPAEEIGKSFDPTKGRPTKELRGVCGLLVFGEFRDWTVEQTANAWCYDASIQYALNLPRDRQYLSERAVDDYRRLLRESEAAQEVFEEVTAAIVRELKLEIKKQRLDSTHINSNMAKFGRLKLLVVAIKRFLEQVKRDEVKIYEELPEELRNRYTESESRLFGIGTKKTRPYEEAIEEAGRDMAELIGRFADVEKIEGWKSFKALARAFSEHYEVTETEIASVLPKAEDENGQSSRVMQNPSDMDAGYDGHKGPGYQVQISQAYDTGEEGPGIIAGCIAQSAAESDSAALAEMYEQQERMGTKPEQTLADGAYGSQGNVEMSASIGVKLVSPVSGKVEKTANKNEAQTAVMEMPLGGRKLTVAEEKREKLNGRRAEQETPEWKREYAKRSGVEGVHEALDRMTGIKRLRVRGMQAVSMSVYFKVTGWNISAAAKIMQKRRKKAKMEAVQRKNTGIYGTMRRYSTTLTRGKAFSLPRPRFSRSQRGIFSKVRQGGLD
jgi:hypothetical protein